MRAEVDAEVLEAASEAESHGTLHDGPTAEPGQHVRGRLQGDAAALCASSASSWGSDDAAHVHGRGDPRRDGRQDGRGRARRRVRRGRRLFRRRVPLHRGPAAQIRQVALLRRADQRERHRRRRDRHGRLWPAARRGDPVRRLRLSRLRPDRLGGGAAALPLGRASSSPRSSCACPAAAASTAGRRTARARRRCSPMSAA